MADLIIGERMFKKSERDFWLYPKLLLIGLFCIALSVLLSLWLPSSWAFAIGFIPFFAIFPYAGRPLSYRQWFIRILITLFALGVGAGIVSIVKMLLG